MSRKGTGRFAKTKLSLLPMAIPFVRQFEFEYGVCAQLSPLIQRVIARNPGPFTYTGTGVYIIGAFKPDIEIRCGDNIEGDSWTIEAIHTPGHTSNHMCFALQEENTLFSGDHIMGWSTSVVSPPDGHMGDYLESLERVKARGFDRIWPTHGPCIDDVDNFVGAYIDHRHAREAQILDALNAGLTEIMPMVERMYVDVDKRLYPAAAHSVLSHLIHMRETGRVTAEGKDGLKTEYRPAA